MRLLPLSLLSLLLTLSASAVLADPGSDALDGLKASLREDEGARRAAGVLEFSRHVGVLAPAQGQRAAVLLKKTLEEDPDGAVRRAAVRGLSRLPSTTAWVPVLLASFADRDPTVQKEARRAVLSAGGAFLQVVQRLIAEDQDPTFRADLLLILRDRRRPDAIPLLLEALDGHLRVRAAAVEALEAISGKALGYDAAAWRKWAAERAAEPVRAKDPNETVTVAPDGEEVKEPPPFTPASLVPDFYGLPLHAKDIVFVVDVSGSVGSGGVEHAKRQVENAVELLASDVRISALFFDEQVKMWRPEMVPATPRNKADLAKFLRAIVPGRRTDVFTPLNAGLQILRRRIEEKAKANEPFREAATMIVVSDGVETSGKTPPRVVEDKLEQLDLSHSVVHAIVLGGKDSPLLHALAARGGGQYIVVDK